MPYIPAMVNAILAKRIIAPTITDATAGLLDSAMTGPRTSVACGEVVFVRAQAGVPAPLETFLTRCGFAVGLARGGR